MNRPRLQRRTWALVAVIVPMVLLFVYVAARSGPLASVDVAIHTVEARPVAPALFGIGTVQARYTYKIGPTVAGRVQSLAVHVGDVVKAGQVLGVMEAVDLDERMAAQAAAIKSSAAALLQAQARQSFAQAQASRYEQLLEVRGTSEESVAIKRQELAIAHATWAAAQADVARLHAERDALRAQRGNLRLLAPVAGQVAARNAEPGTTVVAGQAVVEVIDPTSLWVDARFDQASANGLAAGLPARMTLRSRLDQALVGHVMRIELRADAVTEELLAKIVWNTPPAAWPALGELAEVTVQLDALPPAPTIPNAAIRTVQGQRGVWKLVDGDLAFAPIQLGRADLSGDVQVSQGLAAGERIVVYSAKALRANSRIQVVERLTGGSR